MGRNEYAAETAIQDKELISMINSDDPAHFEVKCKNCDEFYPIETVHLDDNNYYCPDCFEQLKQKIQPCKEILCAVCSRTLDPRETVIYHYEKSYCPSCYEKSPPSPVTLFFRNDGKVDYSQYMEFLREHEWLVCKICKKEISPCAVRVQVGNKTYCDNCYELSYGVPTRRVNHALHQSRSHPGNSITVLRNADPIFECKYCGMIFLINKLREDQHGKFHCPKCNKDLDIRRAKQDESTDEDLDSMAQLFKRMGDPCRVKIIEALSDKELNVNAFVEITGAQYSLTSYHLKVLKDLGLIQSYKDGNFVIYSLTEKGKDACRFINKYKGQKSK